MAKLPIFILICVFAASVQAQGQDVQKFMKIEPLVATRADVEKIFGAPSGHAGPYVDVALYETKDATMRFTYSRGPCNVDHSRWNVVADTVIRTDITLHKAVLLKDLGIEIESFEKHPVKDVENAFSLESDAMGIYIGIASNGSVEGIERQPASRFDAKACPR